MRGTLKKGVVTIAFDDAYLDTCKYAIRHLDRFNIKSTIAVPADLIGKTFEKRRLVDLKMLKGLVKSGHEIASHTLTHSNLFKLSLRDDERTVSEIAGSKRKLEALLSCTVNSFVFPYINRNQSNALRSKVKAHYKSLRITCHTPSFNGIPVKNSYKLSGFAVMKKHSLSYLNKQIDYAEKNKRWLIEVFHLVSNKNTLSAHRPKPYRFFMHIDDFKKHIDYILSKNVKILPQGEVVRRYRGVSP